MVVSDPREAEYTIKKQIRQLVQLNEGQPHTFDRDALIKMLDEAQSQARPCKECSETTIAPQRTADIRTLSG